MDPLIGAALISGGVTSAQGIATGIGTARAGKKMMLTPRQQKELEELQRRKQRGELGLTERELGSLEQKFLAEQAGAQRELEATALQQAAARGLSGAVSGRDIFLQEQAQAQAERGMRQQQNIIVEEANRAEAAAEEARIDAMVAQQKEAEAMRAQGIAQAASLGLLGGAAGVGGAMQITGEAQDAANAADAAMKKTNDLATDYNRSVYAEGFKTYGFGMQPAPVGGQ